MSVALISNRYDPFHGVVTTRIRLCCNPASPSRGFELPRSSPRDPLFRQVIFLSAEASLVEPCRAAPAPFAHPQRFYRTAPPSSAVVAALASRRQRRTCARAPRSSALKASLCPNGPPMPRWRSRDAANRQKRRAAAPQPPDTMLPQLSGFNHTRTHAPHAPRPWGAFLLHQSAASATHHKKKQKHFLFIEFFCAPQAKGGKASMREHQYLARPGRGLNPRPSGES